jgi:hypothetical protein
VLVWLSFFSSSCWANASGCRPGLWNMLGHVIGKDLLLCFFPRALSLKFGGYIGL